MPHTTVIFHTDSLPHQHFYTQSLLRTNTVTRKHFYTQTLLHKRFHTATLLHTNTLNADTFTQNHFYIQALVHADPLPEPTKLAKNLSFWHSNIISCEKVAAGPTKLARNPQFLQLKHHFGRKGCRRTNQIFTKTSVFDTQSSFSCENVTAEDNKLQKYISFCDSNLISRERVAAEVRNSQFYLSFWH